MMLKGMCQEEEGMSEYLIESLWKKVLDLQAPRRGRQNKLWLKRHMGVPGSCYRRPQRVIIRRRRSLEGSRRRLNGVGRRIKVLQKLVPNGDSRCLDRLFMEVADYILCLEMKVKVMQIMVKVLLNSN